MCAACSWSSNTDAHTGTYRGTQIGTHRHALRHRHRHMHTCTTPHAVRIRRVRAPCKLVWRADIISSLAAGNLRSTRYEDKAFIVL